MHCAHGDIHDIGKNVAAALIRSNGYKVIDLGSDVPEETVVKAAKDNKADLVTGTALMTTTMSAFAPGRRPADQGRPQHPGRRQRWCGLRRVGDQLGSEACTPRSPSRARRWRPTQRAACPGRTCAPSGTS